MKCIKSQGTVKRLPTRCGLAQVLIHEPEILILDGEDAVITSTINEGTLFKESKSRSFDQLFISESSLKE
ncbi:hypothetical protein [Plebeiibacterium marinum]|uniref:Uncharacterized protein n=1 Tax=Plebeiibacterium marinum TaxID=2992111 RepID=A0AAE3MI74_9BACT|nr:hypothetical protein [Plebeiobacterium marinum]MCW3807989.1 hypothetical protein [Plebeiobacterium marinum]